MPDIDLSQGPVDLSRPTMAPPPPVPPQFNPLQSSLQRLASAETPGVNYTGGRQDAQPRDVQTDQPLNPPEEGPSPPSNQYPVAPSPGPQNYVRATTLPREEWAKDSTPLIDSVNAQPNMPGGPKLPREDEAINITRGTGQWRQNFAAPAVAGPAGLAAAIAGVVGPFYDLISNNAFSRAYREGALGGLQQDRLKLQMQREQMDMQRDRMIDLQEQADHEQYELTQDYNLVFNKYDQLKGKHDGVNTPEEIAAETEEIRQLNGKHNHRKMDWLLDNIGPDGVRNALEQEHRIWQDSKNSNATNKRARDQRADEEADPVLGTASGGERNVFGGTAPAATGGGADPLGLGTGPAPESTPATGSPEDKLVDPDPKPPPDNWVPEPTPEEPTSEAPETPGKQGRAALGPQVAARGDIASDVPQPGISGEKLAQAAAPAEPAEPAFDYKKSPVLDRAQQIYPNMTQANRDVATQMAFDMMMGNYKGPKEKRALAVVEARRAEMEMLLNRIKNDKKLEDPDINNPNKDLRKKARERQTNNVVHAVDMINPYLAEHVKGYIDGSLTPPQRANIAKGPWAIIYGLAHKADPTIDPNSFARRQGTQKSFAYGQDGRTVTSVGTDFVHLKSYQEAVEDLAKFEKAHPHLIDRIVEKAGGWKFAGDYLEFASRIPGMGALGGVGPEELKQVQKLFGRLDTFQDTAGTEYERALTNGVPRVTTRALQMEKLDWKAHDTDQVLSVINSMKDALHKRMEQMQIRYKAGTGKDDDDMARMFNTYAAEGRGGDFRDDLGTTSAANADTAKIVDWLIKNPGKDLPPELYPAAPAGTAPISAPEDRHKGKAADYFKEGPAAPASGGDTSGRKSFRDFF